MKVKICGITDLDSALFAVEQGADALGFVFAESKRKVSPEKAQDIVEKLPKHVMKIGVFVNESGEVIERMKEQVGLTAIQLHGDESPEFCRAFAFPVIKALRIGSKHDLGRIKEYECDYVLLDSPKGKYYGGNGVKFDWGLLSDFSADGKKIILAGGLNEGNIREAVQTANPFMVDVSSGVETDEKKDFEKIEKFIRIAKRALEEEVR
jgi:phosphoribosylanthranilate isomerase